MELQIDFKEMINMENGQLVKGSLLLTITNDCNMCCVYCYQEKKRSDIISLCTAKQILHRHLNDKEKFSFLNIVLFGGEPFLYFERIKEICEWTWGQKWSIPYIFNFSTNGTLLDEKVKRWLIHNAHRILLTLSADGERDSQNINRCNSFDRIDFSFFIRNWPRAFVKMTISQKTLHNMASDIIFFHQLGFSFAECNLAVGIDWQSKDNEEIIKRELNKLVEYYAQYNDVNPAPIINLQLWKCSLEKKREKSCGIGESVIMYDSDGKLYPCNYITPMSFDEENLKYLLNIDYSDVNQIIDEKCYKECYFFPICPTCYGGDYAINRKIKMKNYSLCKLVKIRAYYSALLKAVRIKKQWENSEMTREERIRLRLEIQAIQHIVSEAG